MDVIIISALVVLIAAGVALMLRSDSPTWFLWPGRRLHWLIWVIAAVLWALMLTLY